MRNPEGPSDVGVEQVTEGSQVGAFQAVRTSHATRATDSRSSSGIHPTSPPLEELSSKSLHLDESGPRPRGAGSQGQLVGLAENQT